MSIASTGRRARTRALGLVATGALVAGLLSTVPTAVAAGQSPHVASAPGRPATQLAYTYFSPSAATLPTLSSSASSV